MATEPSRGRTGVYPGSFNPPTHAHLAIADAARHQRRLDHVDLAVSRIALAKEDVERPLLQHRIDVVEASVADLDWCDVVVTDLQLLADIAEGYDVLILGADKWQQVLDASFYTSVEQRDAAVARLPELAVARRPPAEAPDHVLLDIDPELADTSSSAARAGATSLMTSAAAAFDRRTGAWTDPDRYSRWLRAHRS